MKKRNTMAATAILAQGLCCLLAVGSTTVVRDGQVVGTIVLGKTASPSEQWAASELTNHFAQMSGAAIGIVVASDELPENAIILGNGEAARFLGVETDPEALGTDGYVLKTVGNRLVVAGGRTRGTLYGVYDVLDRMGCRWWYPGESTVPTLKTIVLPVIDIMEAPVLDYRELLYGDIMADTDEARLWRARNRINGGMFKKQEERYGGQLYQKRFTHSYWDLLEDRKGLFKEHPEYFSLVKSGKRAMRQPCFSSEEMVRLMAEGTIKAYEEHPEWLHHTIGQEDNYDHCLCEDCKVLFEKHGGSGAQIDFALRVAEIVRRKHPDIPLNVPAFTWTRTPPRSDIRPDGKMSVSLANIECSFARPLEDGIPHWNAEFVKDLKAWAKLTRRINIWTYSTSFRHYLIPFPNYYTTGPNLRFYVANGVKGVLAQGPHTTPHGSLSPLDIWLWSRLMWNPWQNERSLVKEFADGYFGPAGRHILDYLNDLHASVLETGSNLFIRMMKGVRPSEPFLTPELIGKAEQHFALAAEAVKDDPVLLRRVRIAYLPVQYTVLKRFRQLWPVVLGTRPDADPADYARQFSETVSTAGIRDVADHATSEQFIKWAAHYGEIMAKDPRGDLPDELKDADMDKVRLFQAAQWDSHMRYLRENPEATDGWTFRVYLPAWVHQHFIRAPFDYTVGKTYDVYARVRARVVKKLNPDDVVFNVGIFIKDGKDKPCCADITAGQVDGTFQTYHVGEFAGEEHTELIRVHNDGIIWIALDSGTYRKVKDVELDCVWLVERDIPRKTGQ